MGTRTSSESRGLFCSALAWFKQILKLPASRGIVGAAGIIALAALLVWLFKPSPAHPASTYPASTTSDPSVVIGTFITLYGLFLAGFGALASFVVKEGNKKKGRFVALRAAAITFLVAATLTDLLRVRDATSDLSTAATYGLSHQALNDDIIDFQIYFFLNIAVIIFGIVVACLPSGEQEPESGGQVSLK